MGQVTHVVCVNAWMTDGDGNQTYTDDPNLIEGWSVYVRTELEDGTEPFDVPEDFDFPTYEEAMARAKTLALQYGTEDIREY